MKQLDLFARTPLLEVGKAYRFVYGYNNQYCLDAYVDNMKYHGDTWNPYVSISYFITCENKIASMATSSHDCCCFIWQQGSKNKIEIAHRLQANSYYELTGSELIGFISKLRSASIRSKFNLPAWRVNQLGVEVAC